MVQAQIFPNLRTCCLARPAQDTMQPPAISINKTQNSSQVTSSQSSSSHQRSTQDTNSKALGSASPKLSSYKGTAEKCKFVGETVRHFNAGKPATFELFAPGAKKGDVDVNIISPEKRHIPHKVVDSGNGVFRIEFTTVEVGSYVIDVTVSSLSVPRFQRIYLIL